MFSLLDINDLIKRFQYISTD